MEGRFRPIPSPGSGYVLRARRTWSTPSLLPSRSSAIAPPSPCETVKLYSLGSRGWLTSPCRLVVKSCSRNSISKAHVSPNPPPATATRAQPATKQVFDQVTCVLCTTQESSFCCGLNERTTEQSPARAVPSARDALKLRKPT